MHKSKSQKVNKVDHLIDKNECVSPSISFLNTVGLLMHHDKQQNKLARKGFQPINAKLVGKQGGLSYK